MNQLNVTTNKLYVGDAFYLIDSGPKPDRSIVLRNVLKGVWNVTAKNGTLHVMHSNVSPTDCHVTAHLGMIKVDAANVTIGSLTKLANMSTSEYDSLFEGEQEDTKSCYTTVDDGEYSVFICKNGQGIIVAIYVEPWQLTCDECGCVSCECCPECQSYDCFCCERCGYALCRCRI